MKLLSSMPTLVGALVTTASLFATSQSFAANFYPECNLGTEFTVVFFPNYAEFTVNGIAGQLSAYTTDLTLRDYVGPEKGFFYKKWIFSDEDKPYVVHRFINDELGEIIEVFSMRDGRSLYRGPCVQNQLPL